MSDFYLTLPSHSTKKEFLENESNQFKIRLPHPIQLEGSGWKVGLLAISIPDPRCHLSMFSDSKDPLFKMSWQGQVNNIVSSMIADYKFEEVLLNFDSVNSVGFRKGMVNFFQKFRINDGGTDSRLTFGWTFVKSDGKRTYMKFKWEGTHWSPTMLTQTRNRTSQVFFINKELAYKMKWVIQHGS